MKYIKLTDANCRTHGGYDWTKKRVHRATGDRRELCTDGLFHVYRSLEEAAIFAPIHGAAASYTRAWVVEGKEYVSDETKVGCRQIVWTGKELTPIELTTDQRVAVAIVCAWSCCDMPIWWRRWAVGWMSGKNRTDGMVWGAARDAAWAAARAAYGVRDAAAMAAWAAARAAEAVRDAERNINVSAIVCRVLDTPESRWAELVEESNDE